MKKNYFKLNLRILIIILLISFIETFNSYAIVKLPRLVGDNMVLQRNTALNIWGWADKGEKVTVEFNGQQQNTVTGKDGKWLVKFTPMKEGGPFEMTLSGKNTIKLRNILIGDVWVCSGQSNMEMTVGESNNYEYEVAHANFPMIHIIDVQNIPAFSPVDDISSNGWSEVKPETIKNFSALGYFFGRELFKKYHTPIGLLQSDWGGTPAEYWISAEGLKPFPEFDTDMKKYILTDKQKIEAKKKFVFDCKNWGMELDKFDIKCRKGVSWADLSTDTRDWNKMKIPGLWEVQGLPDFDGIVWFRKEMQLSKEQAGIDLTLFLAKIDDLDNTYFNGVQVGSTDSWNTERKYVVPGKLVKEGKNVISVRVVDFSGGGGIFGLPSELFAVSGSQKLPLDGEWLYKVASDIKQVPQRPQANFDNSILPTTLYNGMIYPLLNYAIKGAIWYQGESNAGSYVQYRKLFPSLITDWRQSWGLGDFPFLFVNLANFESGGNEWPFLREAQTMTLSLPNTGMATAIDVGDSKNIHPKNKQELGRRLALEAMRVGYKENIVSTGPMYQSMTVEGNKIRIKFTRSGSGLLALRSEVLNNFTIAGDDKKFVSANAYIEDNTVVIETEKIANPVAVRYAWHTDPQGINLYNIDGFPAVPFRTDNWTE